MNVYINKRDVTWLESRMIRFFLNCCVVIERKAWSTCTSECPESVNCDIDMVLPLYCLLINKLLWLLVQTVVCLWVQRSRIIEFKVKRLSSDSLFLKMWWITGDCEWTTARASRSITTAWGARGLTEWCWASAGSCCSRLTPHTLEHTATSSGQSAQMHALQSAANTHTHTLPLK